jgi:hypothetical protein
LVTVTLKNWHSICWRLIDNSTKPARAGFVRLCADAIRVSIITSCGVTSAGKSSLPSFCNRIVPVPSLAEEVVTHEFSSPVACTSNPMLPIELVSSEVSNLAGRILCTKKEFGPHLFLVSAFLVSR